MKDNKYSDDTKFEIGYCFIKFSNKVKNYLGSFRLFDKLSQNNILNSLKYKLL